MHDKQSILEFISGERHMIISTVNDKGEPESAVVGFGQTESFELIFGTVTTSRKANNLLKNKRVSVVIGTDMQGTVQYQGEARMLFGDEADRYSEIYFQKTPGARHHKDNPDERYYLISPTWIRFTDTKLDPWGITELRF